MHGGTDVRGRTRKGDLWYSLRWGDCSGCTGRNRFNCGGKRYV